MIEAQALTKKFGDTTAVNDISFNVTPGIVTGFLGPNGAGKSTTMRMILGLDNPTGGSVTVNGKSYRDSPAPMQEVGALLDAKAIHTGRTAYQHLRWLAQAGGVPRSRIGEVLEIVGLSDVAGKRIGGFSLGMFQRLGIASALLGDPETLLFDEPVNGLDPEGILWIRNLMKRLADEGRTIFVSSHLMSEMEETADHVLVIGRGRLIADTSMDGFIQMSASNHVKVVTPQSEKFAQLLTAEGATITNGVEHELNVVGMDAASVGEFAAKHNIPLHELTPRRARLEAAFMELTRDSVEYQSHESAGPDQSASGQANQEVL